MIIHKARSLGQNAILPSGRLSPHSSTAMLQPDTEGRPDTDLIAEIVTPLYAATALFALLALSFVLGSQQRPQWSSYVVPGVLLISALAAREATQRGWLRVAGILIATVGGILPVVTLFTVGVEGN